MWLAFKFFRTFSSKKSPSQARTIWVRPPSLSFSGPVRDCPRLGGTEKWVKKSLKNTWKSGKSSWKRPLSCRFRTKVPLFDPPDTFFHFQKFLPGWNCPRLWGKSLTTADNYHTYFSSDDEPKCTICLGVRLSQFLFVPCGHADFCSPCAATVMSQPAKTRLCPICRSPIQSKVQVFAQT